MAASVAVSTGITQGGATARQPLEGKGSRPVKMTHKGKGSAKKSAKGAKGKDAKGKRALPPWLADKGK
jgi:hypothetical protein